MTAYLINGAKLMGLQSACSTQFACALIVAYSYVIIKA